MAAEHSFKRTAFMVLFLFCTTLPVWAQKHDVRAEAKEQAKIDAVVIRSSSLGTGTKGKRNGAILLSRAEDIERHVDLFLNNQRFPHACGYHYDIEFWSGNDRQNLFQYNIECGEEFARNTDAIASLMDGYDQQFIAGTVNTIHYLEVPVSQDPQALIEQMRKDGLHIFPLDGVNARYPSLEINFTVQGEDTDTLETNGQTEMQRFLENWPDTILRPLTYTPPAFSGGIYSGGQATVKLKSLIRFPLNANLEAIETALETYRIETVRSFHPRYYVLMWITSEERKGRLVKTIAPYKNVRLL